MTVEELIAKLQRFPKSLPVFVESAPWGIPFEAEIVERDTLQEDSGRKKKTVVMVTHNVGV